MVMRPRPIKPLVEKVLAAKRVWERACREHLDAAIRAAAAHQLMLLERDGPDAVRLPLLRKLTDD